MAVQTYQSSAAQYGGFWIRFLALMADSAILIVAGIVIIVVSSFLGEVGALIGACLYLLLQLLYWPIMQASARQATFGKAMLGLKVTDGNGQRLSILRSFGRELAKIISGVVLMLGFLVAAFTGRKQALHDLIASTYVVREGPAHVADALVVSVVGIVGPMIAIPMFGAAMFMGMVASMFGDMKTEMQKPKTALQVAPPASKPAPQAPAAQPKAAPAVQATPAAAARGQGDFEALVAATLTGLEKPGTTRAGPAILELGTLFGTSFWLKTYMPALKEFEGSAGAVTVIITRVMDKSGADLYDSSNQLESGFFQRVSISPASSPVPHLSGTRQVSLRKGAGTGALERVEGTLKLAVPVKLMSASFAAADAGKEQTVHGATIGLRSISGKDVELRYRGVGNRLVAVQGFGSDGKSLSVQARYNWPESADTSDAQFKLTFNAPVSRVQANIAESILERQFPFTVTKTSIADAPSALATAKAPGQKPAESPAAVAVATTPAPAPAKLEPTAAPAAAPMASAAPKADVEKSATPSTTPKARPANALTWTPPPAAVGPVVNPSFNDLMTAVMYRSSSGVSELLAVGKWPDKPDGRGVTPLMAAVLIGDALSAEALLKGGANPNLSALNGQTAGAIARERRDSAMQSLLERHGAR